MAWGRTRTSPSRVGFLLSPAKGLGSGRTSGTDGLDYLGLNAALYEWADSYDSKDWDRLRKCIAPTLRVRPVHITVPHLTHKAQLN